MTEAANQIDQPTTAAAPHLIVAPAWVDETTGATYIHKDLMLGTKPYEFEDHIGPVQLEEKFGDAESWAAYVSLYGVDGAFCTWSSQGLRAVLDYPDRRQWVARHAFKLTPEMAAWAGLANGAGVEHKKAVEFLEDHAPDIFEPDEATLLTLLRSLRGSVNATAATELRADGTSSVRFSKDAKVIAGGDVMLPPEITIAIPVLRGHVDDNGLPVRYKLVLKLRASVGTDAHLALRFAMPAAETVLEQVYAERVAAAKALLGDDFTILRAAE